MRNGDATALLSDSMIQRPTAGRVARNEATAEASLEQATRRRGWQEIIDNTLIEWGRDPSRLADDQLLPLAPKAIGRAIDLAIKMRDTGRQPPLRVSTSGEGGIVFERWGGKETERIEIAIDELVLRALPRLLPVPTGAPTIR